MPDDIQLRRVAVTSLGTRKVWDIDTFKTKANCFFLIAKKPDGIATGVVL